MDGSSASPLGCMSDPTAIDFPSHDGSKLSFRILGQSFRATDFLVSVESKFVTASVEADTFFKGPPSLLFTDLAKNWRGWSGEKVWKDIEGKVKLVATSDLTGHIEVRVTLRSVDQRDSAQVTLMYEAGALERMSKLLRSLFAADAT